MRASLSVRSIFIVFLSVWGCALTASAEAAKHALIIGISKYQNIKVQLPNAAIDADAMERKLREAGYQTTTLRNSDATRDSLLKSWSAFLTRILPNDEVVVYYSGHGVVLKSKNHIVPADAPSTEDAKENILDKQLIAFTDLQEDLEKLNVSIQVWIIDACRNNPFSSSGRSFEFSGGLTIENIPPQSLVFYSANVGQVALERLSSDGDQDLGSPFSRIFAQTFDDFKDQSVVEFAREVRLRFLQLLRRDGTSNPQFPLIVDAVLLKWCFVTCNKQEKTPSNEELMKLIATIAASMRDPPALSANVVYLGKMSRQDCDIGTAENAFPFGCDTLKYLAREFNGTVDPITLKDTQVVSGVEEVNVRKRFPGQIGNQLLYDCKVKLLKRRDKLNVKYAFPYITPTDTYFFGAMVSEPMKECMK